MPEPIAPIIRQNFHNKIAKHMTEIIAYKKGAASRSASYHSITPRKLGHTEIAKELQAWGVSAEKYRIKIIRK